MVYSYEFVRLYVIEPIIGPIPKPKPLKISQYDMYLVISVLKVYDIIENEVICKKTSPCP